MAKGRILAIDDELFFRQIYLDLLGAEGYFVRTACSGEEGVDWLRREDFDLVITDMEMPGMNGVETTEAIKRFNPEQEVMVVTAKRDVAFAVEAMKQGVSEYILKPVIPEEFLHLVNQVIFRQAMRKEHQKLLDENIEYFSALAASRKCLAFLQIHDLDRLGDLILDTLMELLEAEGAMLWLTGFGGQGFRLRCRRGLSRSGLEEEIFQPGETEHRLVTGGKSVFVEKETALLIPLTASSVPQGFCRVEIPSGRRVFNRGDLKVADLVAEFAAVALQNVLLFRSLERDSLRVPRGEAYNMAFFRDHLGKEIYSASRHGRHLSLVRLKITNYAELAGLFFERELEDARSQVVEAVNGLLRDADILAMAGPDEFCILLPETDYWGSLVAQKRIRKALKGNLALEDLRQTRSLEILMRSAVFPRDGNSFDELNRAAGERLRRLRESLLLRHTLENNSFWEIAGRLLGTAEDYQFVEGDLRVSSRLSTLEEPLTSRYFCLPCLALNELTRAICREAAESGQVRGIIYRGCNDFESLRPVLPTFESLEKSSTSLFFLGGTGRTVWDSPRVFPIFIDDERIRKVAFLLHLNEDSAYALLARKQGNRLLGFHTEDYYFVENMIEKLQEQYQLQTPY